MRSEQSSSTRPAGRIEIIRFPSGADYCAGMFFRPRSTDSVPCVVLANGTASTLDRLIPHAARFAAEGFAALVFDYRHFGRSGGRPRQLVRISAQIEDLKNAVGFVRSHAAVDARYVGLWGTSLGGGLAVRVGASLDGLSGIAIQIPFNGFPKRVEGRNKKTQAALTLDILIDLVLSWLGLRGRAIKLVGTPEERAAIVNPEVVRHTLEVLEAGSAMENRILPRSFVSMMRFKPSRSAHLVHAPLFLCLASRDTETPFELSKEIADRARNATVRFYDATHTDFYEADMRDRVLSDQITFFRRCFAGGL